MSEEQEKQTETESVPQLVNIFTIQQGWDDFAKFCYQHIDGVDDLTESELIARQYVFLAGCKVAMQVHGCGIFFSHCKASNVIGQIHQMVEESAEKDLKNRLKETLGQMLKKMMEQKSQEPALVKVDIKSIGIDLCEQNNDSSQL